MTRLQTAFDPSGRRRENAAVTGMSSFASNSATIIRERIVSFSRLPDGICCVLANQGKVLLPRLLISHIAIGDEITFPIPDREVAGAEVYLTKARSFEAANFLYLAPLGGASQPHWDKRGRSFVSTQVRHGALGIATVALSCDALREYFYRIGTSSSGSGSSSLYQTLRIGTNASLAEIRVAFKLRALELKTVGAPRAEQVKLERAFNILGYPELRAHYDLLLADPNLPAIFPYGGFGSLLISGERSRDGKTFFARRILAFLPEQRHRRFHLPLRGCDFYIDKALYRDVRRKLQFWLDPALAQVAWDPSWNRWKHMLSTKIEVDGTFVRSGRYERRGDDGKFVDWETGLPSRLSLKLSTDFQQAIEKARNAYCRFGQHSRALDQIRLCLEYKAIERTNLQQMCSELGIPGDFDVTQINWHPDYDPFYYRALFARARRVYIFRGEYIFDLEKAIVVETPQVGNATYVFSKPAKMENFLALYPKACKAAIRRNLGNVAERLGYLRRIIHGASWSGWLNELSQLLGERPTIPEEQPSGCARDTLTTWSQGVCIEPRSGDLWELE